MNTIEVVIACGNESVQSELIALLSDIFYDGFEEDDQQLKAFIREEHFDAQPLEQILKAYNLDYSTSIITDQNWNELWESNFQPVIVNDFCGIRADFHQPLPDVKHEIIITPKMSFGTGHHATTYMMIDQMSTMDVEDKSVIDFGTGTGVLAILAEKLGATGRYHTSQHQQECYPG